MNYWRNFTKLIYWPWDAIKPGGLASQTGGSSGSFPLSQSTISFFEGKRNPKSQPASGVGLISISYLAQTWSNKVKNQDKRVLLRETALRSQIKVYQCTDTSSTLILLTTKSSPAMKLAAQGFTKHFTCRVNLETMKFSQQRIDLNLSKFITVKSFFLLTPSTPGYRELTTEESKCNMLLNWCYIQTKLSYCLHC